MRKKFFFAARVVILCVTGISNVLAQDARGLNCGAEYAKFTSAVINPQDSGSIYAGSGKSIIKTQDRGKTWKEIFRVPGVFGRVNWLAKDAAKGDMRVLYAATSDGLYKSENAGTSWKRIFRGKDFSRSDCLTAAARGLKVYAGTVKGMHVSEDGGRSWDSVSVPIGKSLSFEELSFEDAAEPDQAIFGNGVKSLVFDLREAACLYMLSVNTIYKSEDKGKRWEALSDDGLLGSEVKSLASVAGFGLCALTDRGVFFYRDERWIEFLWDTNVEKAVSLTAGAHGEIMIAAEDGLFWIQKPSEGSGSSAFSARDPFDNEPSIALVHQAAVEYAEVNIEKIKQWRKAAKAKALLPSVNLGLNRDTTDLWHWEGGSTTKLNDDTLMRGEECINWDISLSWDLSDLIWNNDQTSIDSRSRMMVELRESILEEVTKLYFDRLRVKAEIDGLSIEERKKRFDKELKIKEFTARLDALTDGAYSKALALKQ